LGTLSYAYDLAGRRTRITHGDGFFADYDHLLTGEVSAIRENGATSGVGVLASYAHDDLGRRTSLTRGNGTATSYGYDAVSRLASLTQDLAGTGGDLTLGFTHNPAGQIVTNTRSNDLYSWAGATTGTVTTPANALNQAVSAGGTALTYDAKGNLTWDGTRSYGYTAENKLTAVQGGNLGYDPLGRLFVVGGEGLLLNYDGDALIAEHVNSAGNPVARRYVHGPGTDEPLAWYEGAGTTDRRFLHADERGSIVAVTDSAGATIATNRYDEYGIPASTNAGRFQYTGQMWLPVPGMYSYKARFYAPKLGRFLQPDPIGYDDGMNMYGYVGGDPVNFTDPSGMKANDDPDKDGCEGLRFDQYDVCGPRQGKGGNREHVGMGPSTPLKFAASLLPGYGLYECYERGCSRVDLAFAVLDLVPIAKPLTTGRRVVKAINKACGCFEAGTLVATPSGLLPIEQIEVGDMVLAVNEQTGEIAPKPVTDLIRPEPKPLYALHLLDAGGEAETFHATDDHPWKVEGKGWVETVNLKPQDRIDTGSGADMVVTSLEQTGRIEHTYNLTVADWHTFMVGEDQAVVHNACKGLAANPFEGKTAAEIAKMLTNRGFIPKGKDPLSGRGTFVNPQTGRSYHLDLNHAAPKGPHVGVHRPRGSARDTLPVRDYRAGR
jgi:RHS repeat-associated protein